MNTDEPRLQAIADLCAVHLRPAQQVFPDDGEPYIAFDPPLDAAETVVFDDIVSLADSPFRHLTLDQFRAIRDDLDVLASYAAAAEPQPEDTASAAVAVLRVVAGLGGA